MKRKNKNKKEDWKESLSSKYLSTIKSIRQEFKCSFERAESILKDKLSLKMWREKKALNVSKRINGGKEETK